MTYFRGSTSSRRGAPGSGGLGTEVALGPALEAGVGLGAGTYVGPVFEAGGG